MSTTTTNTIYSYSVTGPSLGDTGFGSTFEVSLSASHPVGFDDSAAIALAADLVTTLVSAGFSDAGCTVTKTDTTDVLYTSNGTAFV